MTYFNLFSDIFITKGATRILISDLQRNTSELYSLELYDLINELKIHSIEDILKNYDDESKELVQEYIDYLLEEEYGFLSKNDWNKNFSPLDTEYNDYNHISDMFIELENIDVLHKIKPSIINLEIRYLVIYSRISFSIDEFFLIDEMFKNSPLEYISIFSPFHNNISQVNIKALSDTTLRIDNLTFYNCKKAPFKPNKALEFTVNFTKQDLKISSCGKVDMKYFNTNMPKVLEAINHNSCLHKKIGIDIDGNIKNCPLMAGSFGNIHDTSLERALEMPGFKKYWNLTKDKIEVCKDCEFRYVCTDCRAFTEQSHIDENGFDTSKPLKCGYDPYTGKWKEWSKNPLKDKTGQK